MVGQAPSEPYDRPLKARCSRASFAGRDSFDRTSTHLLQVRHARPIPHPLPITQNQACAFRSIRTSRVIILAALVVPNILATRRKTNRNRLLGPKRGVPIILATRRKSRACKAASFASSIWGPASHASSALGPPPTQPPIALQARVRELAQGQRNRHLVARAAGHRLGELHVTHARCEIRARDRPLTANRRDEIGLDLPEPRCDSGIGITSRPAAFRLRASDLIP